MPHITMTPPSSAPAVAAAGAGAAAVRRELLRGMVMESTGKRTLRSEFKRDSDACGFDVLARFGGVCFEMQVQLCCSDIASSTGGHVAGFFRSMPALLRTLRANLAEESCAPRCLWAIQGDLEEGSWGESAAGEGRCVLRRAANRLENRHSHSLACQYPPRLRSVVRPHMP